MDIEIVIDDLVKWFGELSLVQSEEIILAISHNITLIYIVFVFLVIILVILSVIRRWDRHIFNWWFAWLDYTIWLFIISKTIDLTIVWIHIWYFIEIHSYFTIRTLLKILRFVLNWISSIFFLKKWEWYINVCYPYMDFYREI